MPASVHQAEPSLGDGGPQCDGRLLDDGVSAGGGPAENSDPRHAANVTGGRLPAAPCNFVRMLNEDVRKRLMEQLDKVHEWPSLYMFKMIFEPDPERLARVLALFPPESEVLRKYSGGGKYLGITVREVMMNAEDVVARYDQASEIPGVIVL